MVRVYIGGCLFFLAAICPGVHFQRNDSSAQAVSHSELTFEAHIEQPVLQPSEAAPPIGTYMLKSPAGKPCIKVTMGAEYIVLEKKRSWYFNLEPSRVMSSGYCGEDAAVLCLTLLGNAARLQFTFRKEKDIFFVTNLTARVSPLPVCQGCANKTYSGSVAHDKLFAAADGQSFKCKSENVLLTSSELRIKLVPLQMQAFSVPKGQYGKEVECWADFNKWVIAISIGAIVVTFFLIVVLTFLFIRDHHRHSYDRL
ncbi:hypothetical protein PAMA_000951 [Pampus argenteus]